jgi:hypothetical protein
MAVKKFVATAKEIQEGVKRFGERKMTKRQRERWEAMTSAQQTAFVEKSLKRFGSRDKNGAIDWEGLMKFIKFLFDLFAPLIIPKT